MRACDLVVVNARDQLAERFRKLSQDYNLKIKPCGKLSMIEQCKSLNVEFVCYYAAKLKKDKIAEKIQYIKYNLSDTFVVIIVEKRLPEKDQKFLKKYGADFLITMEDALHTSRLELAICLTIQSDYIPVKSIEFMPNETTDFHVFHRLPVNQKFLPVVHAGQRISQKKYEKLQEIGEMYIRREDSKKYMKYLKSISKKGNRVGKCRVHLAQLSLHFNQLILTLSDPAEVNSFEKGKELFNSCISNLKALVDDIEENESIWETVVNGISSPLVLLNRAPAVAAYAGALSRQLGVGDPEAVMIGALLNDVGLVEMHPNTTAQVRNGEQFISNPDRLDDYHQHPILSLNICLNKRLPIPDAVKQIISMSHEKQNREGFPKKPEGHKITDEARIVHFAQLLEESCRYVVGETQSSFESSFLQLYKRELATLDTFSMEFLSKLQPVVNEIIEAA